MPFILLLLMPRQRKEDLVVRWQFVLLATWAMGVLILLPLVGVGCAAVPPAATVVVREVRDRSEQAAVVLAVRGDTLHIDAISPAGIGGARVELTSGAWPARVVVRLRYAADRPFSRLEGSGAAIESTGRADEPGTDLETTNLRPDGFEVALPATQRRVLYVHWVDMYR